MTHPLKDWLERKGLHRKAFAERIGVNDSTLHRLIKGSHETSTSTIRVISEGTGGEVSELDLYEAWLAARNTRSGKSSVADKDIAVSCEVGAQ